MKEHASLNSQFDIPAIISGIIYGISMFAAGFAMGVVRVLWLAPMVGEVWAVLLEIPPMLLVCWYLSRQCLMAWFLCQVCLAWSDEHTNVNTMAVASFSTLLVLDSLLSVTLFHRTLGELEEDFTSTKGSIGILAQLLASFFPLIQLAMHGREGVDKKQT